MTGMAPGGPGRPGGLEEAGRGGGAGGSMRGGGLATRLPFNFAIEFGCIEVRVEGSTWAAEPERAVRAKGGTRGNERAGSATIRWRPASMRAASPAPTRRGRTVRIASPCGPFAVPAALYTHRPPYRTSAGSMDPTASTWTSATVQPAVR